MPKVDIEIINKLGLHARASAKLSQLASEYPCEVFLSKNGRRINAKSIMGVMMLAAGIGKSVFIRLQDFGLSRYQFANANASNFLSRRWLGIRCS